MTEKPPRQIFLENLVFLRIYHNFSMAQMATVLDISVNEWEKMEQGKLPQSITVDVIFNAERFFEIPAHQLFEPLKETH